VCRLSYAPSANRECRQSRRFDQVTPPAVVDTANVSCLKCGSVKIRVIAEHAEDDADVKVYLFCPSCQSRELLPAR